MRHVGTQKGDELAERLARYAGECLKVGAELPETKEGRHVRDQLFRSGTAPGAHHSEARSAQSNADFVHKIALAAKEARESVHWLRTSVNAGFLERDISSLIDEGQTDYCDSDGFAEHGEKQPVAPNREPGTGNWSGERRAESGERRTVEQQRLLNL